MWREIQLVLEDSPALAISAEDEEFAPYLNDANLLFLNDSAEMAH